MKLHHFIALALVAVFAPVVAQAQNTPPFHAVVTASVVQGERPKVLGFTTGPNSAQFVTPTNGTYNVYDSDGFTIRGTVLVSGPTSAIWTFTPSI